ncbi:hypothetical protein I3842_16G091300 [Carya illinoinensis]|uniref:Uncharacterized protein n=1 Tax=Carya illinoinensis TaxID=32201 RepID=A0A922A6R2_CARIL|nr:hypothetical protein I3842_16G091300 [Carya illinoinensis]
MKESAAMKIECALDQSRKLNFHPSRRSIYRVPDVLRKVNEKAYIPQLISIGPFHYRSPKLQSMESFKLGLFEDFMKRAGINLEDLVSIVKDLEQSVLERYEGTIEIESNDFMKMILNQLPLFIIKKLYELLPLHTSIMLCFLEFTFYYFQNLNFLANFPNIDAGSEAMHFVDMMRYFYLPPKCQSFPKRRDVDVISEKYSASQLAEAGLKFKPISGESLLDIRFKEGVLEIACFPLDNTTEIYARNIMAWEQSHYPYEAYVTDYIMMLDFLINTGKDVDLLVQQGILVNQMGTDNSKPPLPGNLCTGISYRHVSAAYYDLRRQLASFRRKHWYVILMSRLKHDYFRMPWMGAASAIILLILTLIQTEFTVISTFK